ncbi:D-alanyl-D-alanine carboxypeptidase [Isoptericola jiangsuensis]|uniref:D-alanyl-D-alanine carboxypeptidase n=1 Tax=Isoptericola jiangsuensis TaxID=548579 RepID=A0A2A9F2G2_9MICO|nr:M15 family metallopeptidase [Isoptericola jiangsuensis]PFG44700.1 D-alanyl-D-alanine carboxypeptidase [Isoptericola jiangsuensis]
MPLPRRATSRSRTAGTSALLAVLLVAPVASLVTAPGSGRADPVSTVTPLPSSSPAALSSSAPTPPPAPRGSTLVGWDPAREGVVGEPLTDLVVVAPARGRTAEVQQQVDGAWVTRATATLDDAPVDLVRVTLPERWSDAATTVWRLHLPATPDAAAVTSDEQHVTARWPLRTDPADPTVLVNKEHPVEPARWRPHRLVVPRNAGAAQRVGLQPEAAAAMEELAAAARRATGHRLVMVSAYRSAAYQERLFDRYARQHGRGAAERFSAHAGESEHQTGWAADVTEDRTTFTRFGGTATSDWVAANAWRHGWVVRYTPGAEDVTGYEPEPWHLRYVGPDLAAWLHATGLTLEEAVGVAG